MPVYIKKTYASEIFFMFHRTFLTLCAKRLFVAAAVKGKGEGATACAGVWWGGYGVILCQAAVRLRRRRDAYARGEDDFFFLHAVLGCNGFQKLSFPCVKTMLFRLLFVLHILNLLGCIDSILVAAIFVYKKSSACETSSLRHQAFQTLRAAK